METQTNVPKYKLTLPKINRKKHKLVYKHDDAMDLNAYTCTSSLITPCKMNTFVKLLFLERQIL